MQSVPELRIRAVNDRPVHPDGEYVVYWMIAFRRAHSNFALQRAIAWAKHLQKPLVVLEALRCGYHWASDRLHLFVLQGMSDNARDFAGSDVLYHPYLEPRSGAGKGLVEALSAKACVVVTDDFPCFFLPRMVKATGAKLLVKLEAVDSNGILPLRATNVVYPTAHGFRRFLQKNLRDHLLETPQPNPLARLKLPPAKLPQEIAQQWPAASAALLNGDRKALAALPIDHTVPPASFAGGSRAASKALKQFLDLRLNRYAEERSDPDEDLGSGISPYLHFGQLSPHEVLEEIAKREEWSPDRLQTITNGSREGWWNMSPSAEGFLDQLITWRELGYNFCWQRDDYDDYQSLPEWAQKSLAKHAGDPRPHLYALDQFEAAHTHDKLWNAAQTQLVRQGRMQNYLRMLWGKKILEWSATPQEALDTMIHLNNKYAVDGRNPNSYSGIFWCLGRYDRPWGPERPVVGVIRYMTSENTARKWNVKKYLAMFDPRTDTGDIHQQQLPGMGE